MRNNSNKTNAINPTIFKLNRGKFHFRGIFILFVFTLITTAIPVLTNAQTVTAHVTTGEDDLRGGNSALLMFRLTDGTIRTRTLSTGFGSYTSSTVNLNFTEMGDTFTVSEISDILISHDGRPRNGHLFDTHDNWDLRSMRVFVGNLMIYDSERDPRYLGRIVHRFTREFRLTTIPIGTPDGEPDFVVTGAIASPRGLGVTVRNIGSGTGWVTTIKCFTSSRELIRTIPSDIRTLTAGQSRTYELSFPVTGIVTCFVRGTDDLRNPELVTANNLLRTFVF